MRKSHSIGSYLSSQETISGFCYLAFQLIFLPSVLHAVNGMLSHPLNSAELNFVYYLVNFMAMLLIFHDFLGSSARQVGQHPAYFCQAVILGFVAYYACFHVTDYLVSLLVPGFSNYNDEAIFAMSRGNHFLMFVGTVILVPPAEECFYRGLIFRNLYGKSRWADNIMIERWFRSLKTELIYINEYRSPKELRAAIRSYINDYNTLRPHEALDYATPEDVYIACFAAMRVA